MRHDEAVTAALAGGPIPIEAVLHLRECASCRSELASLQELERQVRHAAPGAADPAWESRLLGRLADRGRSRGALALRAAVGLFLAGALAAGLYSATLVPKASGMGEAVASAAAFGTPSPSELRALLSSPEDSTSTLLDLTGQVSEGMPQSPPASLRDYLGPTDSGGWNG